MKIWMIYLPLFILIFVIVPMQRRMLGLSIINRRRRGLKLTNEILKKYVGKNCSISTGSFGVNIVGVIKDVNENWLEVVTKKGNELINAEFIQSIKEMPSKK